jgi:hypothetical protein
VSQYVADVDASLLVENPGDQAILIAADVEDYETANDIGMRKVGSDSREIGPVGELGRVIPTIQRPLRIGVNQPELAQGAFRDDPHALPPPLP